MRSRYAPAAPDEAPPPDLLVDVDHKAVLDALDAIGVFSIKTFLLHVAAIAVAVVAVAVVVAFMFVANLVAACLTITAEASVNAIMARSTRSFIRRTRF
jgi:hypothetical protein